MDKKFSKSELMDMLDARIDSVQNLPQAAMVSPINHYDILGLMLLLKAIFGVQQE